MEKIFITLPNGTMGTVPVTLLEQILSYTLLTRIYQKQYFSTKQPVSLRMAKEYEKKLDGLLELLGKNEQLGIGL